MWNNFLLNIFDFSEDLLSLKSRILCKNYVAVHSKNIEAQEYTENIPTLI